MSDVLIVCVRQDVSRAEALASLFDAAGFSISDDPFDVAALKSCGAAVIVWSEASEYSRNFLTAAQRVMDAGKAVIASTVGAPVLDPKQVISVFDISKWDGADDDAALDPLFFAVDHMVMTARDGRVAATLVDKRVPDAVVAGWLSEIPATRNGAQPARKPGRESVLRPAPSSVVHPLRARRPSPSVSASMRAFAIVALIGGAALTSNSAVTPATHQSRRPVVHLTSASVAPMVEAGVSFSEVALAQTPYEPPQPEVRLAPRHGVEPPSAASLSRAQYAPRAAPRHTLPARGFVHASAVSAPVFSAADEPAPLSLLAN